MQYRRLGASGLKVSEVCLTGTEWQTPELHLQIDALYGPGQLAESLVRRAIDEGIGFSRRIASDIANTANMRYILYSNI